MELLSKIRKIHLKLREPFLSASHLIGAALAFIGAVVLTDQCGSSVEKSAVASIYGFSLTILFLVSGLLHGLSRKHEPLLEKLDYIAIYIFIPATYTPLCFSLNPAECSRSLLAAQWIVAFGGIFCTARWGAACKPVQTLIYLILAWMFLSILGTISARLSSGDMALLLAGSACYSIGAAFFALAPDQVWDNRIDTHAVWHVLVLIGATVHYVLVSHLLL